MNKVNEFITKWEKFCDKNKIKFKCKIDDEQDIVTLRFRKNDYAYDYCVSIFSIENIRHEYLDTEMLEILVDFMRKAEGK